MATTLENVRTRSSSETLRKTWKPLTAIVVWGLSFIATKFALRELPPLAIIHLRLLFSIPLLSVLGYSGKQSFRIDARQSLFILLLSLISVIHLYIQLTGLRFTTAANTGWIIGTTPVFIALLSWLFLKEKLDAKKISGIFISLIGLLLLIGKGKLSGISFIQSFGDLLVLASCVTWGFYTVVNRKISMSYSPVMSIFYLFVFMSLITVPFVVNVATAHAVAALSPTGWFAIVFLGVFCSGLGYVLWAQSLSEIKTANAAAFLYLEPFVTILGAWFFLGEPLTGMMMLSGMIIMTGVALVNF